MRYFALLVLILFADGGSLAAQEAAGKAASPPTPQNPFELEIPPSDAEDADVIKLRFFGQHRTRAELPSPATDVTVHDAGIG